MQSQRTLKYPFQVSGIGLHSGKKVTVTVKPAAPDHGIVFFRTDIDLHKAIPANPVNVSSTELCTQIGIDGVKIQTVEHLLSALYGLGVDNASVEASGPEIPIMDGSATPFVDAIISSGYRIQNKSKRCIIVKKAIRIHTLDGKWAEVIPSRSFKISCTIDYDHPLIGVQKYKFHFTDNAAYIRELSRARTFGFLKEVEFLRSKGLARGGSLENAVVIDDFNILNEGGLRYPDEFVRHKVMDTLGDIATAGAYILGHIRTYKGGHTLNNALIKKVLCSRNRIETVNAVDLERSAEKTVHLPEWSDCRAFIIT